MEQTEDNSMSLALLNEWSLDGKQNMLLHQDLILMHTQFCQEKEGKIITKLSNLLN